MLKGSGATVILLVLFRITDWNKLERHLAEINENWFLAALALTLISPLLTALRLKSFLSATDIYVRYGPCALTVLSGSALNLILPARGGDFAKMALLKKETNSNWSALTGVALLERGFDVFALGLIGLLCSAMLGIPSVMAASVCVLTLATAAGLLWLMGKGDSIPFLGDKLERLASTVSRAYKHPKTLAKAVFVAVLCWLVNCLTMGCLLKATTMGTASMLHSLAATPPAILSGIVPVSLWGMGTRDAALAFFLGNNVAWESALAAGFLYTALVYWLLGLIGIPALLSIRRNGDTDNETRQHATASK